MKLLDVDIYIDVTQEFKATAYFNRLLQVYISPISSRLYNVKGDVIAENGFMT